LHLPRAIVASPAVGHDAAFTEEAMELELLERQALEAVDQGGFLVLGQDAGLISESLRQRLRRPKEIELSACGHSPNLMLSRLEAWPQDRRLPPSFDTHFCRQAPTGTAPGVRAVSERSVIHQRPVR